jgi:hypothetical protein
VRRRGGRRSVWFCDESKGCNRIRMVVQSIFKSRVSFAVKSRVAISSSHRHSASQNSPVTAKPGDMRCLSCSQGSGGMAHVLHAPVPPFYRETTHLFQKGV